MTSLPAWPARNEADNQKMLRWLDSQLFVLQTKKIRDAFHRPPFTESERRAYAIKRAKAGDVEPLRRLFIRLADDPEVGRFVNLPKLKKGERWTVNSSNWIAQAAEGVRLIRKLWFEHYGKKRRRKTDGWTAEQFAAEIWLIDASQIERYLKKH